MGAGSGNQAQGNLANPRRAFKCPTNGLRPDWCGGIAERKGSPADADRSHENALPHRTPVERANGAIRQLRRGCRDHIGHMTPRCAPTSPTCSGVTMADAPLVNALSCGGNRPAKPRPALPDGALRCLPNGRLDSRPFIHHAARRCSSASAPASTMAASPPSASAGSAATLAGASGSGSSGRSCSAIQRARSAALTVATPPRAV